MVQTIAFLLVVLLCHGMLQGGVKQQLIAAQEAHYTATRPLFLEADDVDNDGNRFHKRKRSERGVGDFTKGMYKTGRLHATEVTELSQALVREYDQPSKQTVAWASSGSQKNAARNLLPKMCVDSDRSDLYSADVTLWDETTDTHYKQEMYFSLPFEQVEKTLEKHPLESLTKIPDGHPLASTVAEWSGRVGATGDVIPMGIWGDSGQFNNDDSLYVLLFNFLVGPLRYARFPMCAFGKRSLCKCGCWGRHTFDDIFEILAWSYAVSLGGVWPSYRHDNKPFASSRRKGDKRRAKMAKKHLSAVSACCQKRADWQWLKVIGGLCGWDGERTCWKCLCNCTDLPWTDFTLEAKWRATYISHRSFIENVQSSGSYISKLFSVPGFILEFVLGDLMHMSCLGVLPLVLGNVLFEIFISMGGEITKPSAVLDALLVLLKIGARNSGVEPPFTSLSMSMIRAPGKSPKLRCKAAKCRATLKCVLFVLKYLRPPENEYQEIRLALLQHFADMYRLLEEWSKDESKIHHGPLAAESGRKMLLLFTQLSLRQPAGKWLQYWRPVPKCHAMLHCLEEQVSVCGNPRDAWNYLDESTMGDLIDLAESVHPSCVHLKVMEKTRVMG